MDVMCGSPNVTLHSGEIVNLHKLGSLMSLSAASSGVRPAAIIQPATEFGVLQVLAMFDKVLSLCTAPLVNSQKVVDDKDAQSV